MRVLRPLLADQLSENMASLSDLDLQNDVVVFCEVFQETNYVPHHPQKIIFLFSAMRHFSRQLMQKGIHVHYVRLDDKDNTHCLASEFKRLQKIYACEKVVITKPGEWRLLQVFQNENFELREDTRFLCLEKDFIDWTKGKKQLRMEYFYQMMRKKYRMLITDNGEPVGGKWNYDVENREPLKKIPIIPKRLLFNPDEITLEVIRLVQKSFSNHFGDTTDFYYAVTHEDALKCQKHFLDFYLPYFGQYQDVMIQNEPFLYHAVLSMYLNAGLLDAHDLCLAAIQKWVSGEAPLEAVEGFVRQILGWREYIRGIYWHMMPDYQELNFLDAQRPLPKLFWGGDTKMSCVKNVVEMTRRYGYSHHIQRLMITGNFALLAGLSPKEVCAWYLAVYIDAYEWVELPNTLGMALFADGGKMSSKPYAASGRYIAKMSNFCKQCHYDVNEMLGPKACPFNALYWNFIATHEDKLKKNPRMAYMYSTWNRFAMEKKQKILEQAQVYLNALNENHL